MKYLLDPMDLSIKEIDELIEIAQDIIKDRSRYQDVCHGKILATLFFEPSTRTRLSFESAMLSLGGSVLGFSEASSSSAAKGESVTDTIWTVSCYSDIIAMRHPKEGAPYVALRRAKVPLINAGDGGHNHPTQTLTDLLTIHREKNRLDSLTIGFVGDLKYGRTVHSLVKAMSRYHDIKFVFISPKELRVPEYLKEDLLKVNQIEYKEVETIEEAIAELDVLYMTRIQRERFSDIEDYNRLKDSFVLDLKKLETAKEDLTIMHPLPRVNEIAVEVDDDSRAKYFDQVENGRYIRMALILKMLGLENVIERDENHVNSVVNVHEIKKVDKSQQVINQYTCHNPRCITTIEQELNQVFYKTQDDTYRCIYCETKAE